MTGFRLTTLDVATAITAAAIAALAVWAAIAGPAGPVAMQIGLDGQPTRWGDRNELAGLFGFMSLILLATAGSMSWFAKRSEDAARRRGLVTGQGVSLLAIAGTTLLIAWTTLGHAQGGEPPALSWVMGLTGLILAVTGAGLGRVAPNPLIGVRTPWSFKSRLAWDRSNRLAGRLFFWLGIGLLLAGPVAPQPAGMIAMSLLIALAAIWSVFESWRVWRADPDRQPF